MNLNSSIWVFNVDGLGRRTNRLLTRSAATVITDVRIGTPVPCHRSMAARSAEVGGVLSFNASSNYVLGLTLDGAKTGSTADLRPDLPLVVHW